MLVFIGVFCLCNTQCVFQIKFGVFFYLWPKLLFYHPRFSISFDCFFIHSHFALLFIWRSMPFPTLSQLLSFAIIFFFLFLRSSSQDVCLFRYVYSGAHEFEPSRSVVDIHARVRGPTNTHTHTRDSRRVRFWRSTVQLVLVDVFSIYFLDIFFFISLSSLYFCSMWDLHLLVCWITSYIHMISSAFDRLSV